MNVIDFLTAQHREVDALFLKLGKATDKELADEISEKLTKHTELEEKYLYPELEARASTMQYAQHAEKEHAEVKKLLKKWAGQSGEQWEITSKKIAEAVFHHVREEETQMFPEMKREFTDNKLMEIGSKMLEEAGEDPTRHLVNPLNQY